MRAHVPSKIHPICVSHVSRLSCAVRVRPVWCGVRALRRDKNVHWFTIAYSIGQAVPAPLRATAVAHDGGGMAARSAGAGGDGDEADGGEHGAARQ